MSVTLPIVTMSVTASVSVMGWLQRKLIYFGHTDSSSAVGPKRSVPSCHSSSASLRSVLTIAPQHDAGIMTAKPKAVAQSHIHRGLARQVRCIVQITLRVGRIQVDGGWDDSFLN